MNKVTYLVGHDLSREGIAFLCGIEGTAVEYESVDDANNAAMATNIRNNAGRDESEKVDIWKPYILVEVRPA